MKTHTLNKTFGLNWAIRLKLPSAIKEQHHSPLKQISQYFPSSYKAALRGEGYDLNQDHSAGKFP